MDLFSPVEWRLCCLFAVRKSVQEEILHSNPELLLGLQQAQDEISSGSECSGTLQ